MDSHSAAHVLSQIAAYLELSGANRYKARAYQSAARSLLALGSEDIGRLVRSGEAQSLRGIGPATLSVLRDLVETGESRYLEQLREQMPEGLLELMRVPGLTNERIQRLHAEAGIASLDELERAAREGRLQTVKGFGPKTTRKLIAAIELTRASTHRMLYPHAVIQGRALLAAVKAHPDVEDAEIAGSLRRGQEIVSDVDIVAACRRAPESVAASFGRIPGVREASVNGGHASLRFLDGTGMDLFCVPTARFSVAWWRATGSAAHIEAVSRDLERRGLRLDGDALRDASGRESPVASERSVYEMAGLSWIPPELREDQGEVAAASRHAPPGLIEASHIRGALHCHSEYSDGRGSIAQMAEAAKRRGWDYLGISDHSQAAFYASGLTRERVLEQHDEIDELNARGGGVRILKGIEADILADGRLDYDDALLDRFDYVIASIHSRFRQDGAAITERVLTAMDDPHMTILAHPTGRLLMSREPYAIDLDAVFEKAAERGVAIELNCDPHRMDLDWRYLRQARDRGVTIEIGPDAHSPASLEWTDVGVLMARKGWLRREDVLNARDADGVVAFARSRHP